MRHISLSDEDNTRPRIVARNATMHAAERVCVATVAASESPE
jgi:hypothetical protein